MPRIGFASDVWHRGCNGRVGMKTKCPLPKEFSGTRRVSGVLLGLLGLLLSTSSVAGAAPFAYVSYSSTTGGGKVAVIDADPNAACSVPGQTPAPCIVRT